MDKHVYGERVSVSLSAGCISPPLLIAPDINRHTAFDTFGKHSGTRMRSSVFFFYGVLWLTFWCAYSSSHFSVGPVKPMADRGPVDSQSIRSLLYWNVNKAGGYLLWILCFTCGTWNTLREYFPVTSHTTIKPGKKYEIHTYSSSCIFLFFFLFFLRFVINIDVAVFTHAKDLECSVPTLHVGM